MTRAPPSRNYFKVIDFTHARVAAHQTSAFAGDLRALDALLRAKVDDGTMKAGASMRDRAWSRWRLNLWMVLFLFLFGLWSSHLAGARARNMSFSSISL